jgi:DoxX-like family
MESDDPTVPDSRWLRMAGMVVGGLPALFLLVGGAMNLFKPAFVVEGTTALGYPESVIIPLGIVVLACAVLYLIPQTAVLGAILLTGYLGGAVASHVRAAEGWFSILFPVVFGALLWGGLCLRDRRLRALVPLRS